MIRKATNEDAGSIAKIYNYYVENSAITFDEKLWNRDDAIHKLEHIEEGGYPFFVYCLDGEVVGYCYLSSWNFRDAYRTTAETTIYLSPEHKGRKIGNKLMKYLIEWVVATKQYHALIACITVPNDISVALHEKLGFEQVSFFREVGYKLGKWQDVGHWILYV
ncbi:MAG: N-acetyltransferase family protein [Rikenellaceae bacterium]